MISGTHPLQIGRLVGAHGGAVGFRWPATQTWAQSLDPQSFAGAGRRCNPRKRHEVVCRAPTYRSVRVRGTHPARTPRGSTGQASYGEPRRNQVTNPASKVGRLPSRLRPQTDDLRFCSPEWTRTTNPAISWQCIMVLPGRSVRAGHRPGCTRVGSPQLTATPPETGG
jgi:hypothetical protein